MRQQHSNAYGVILNARDILFDFLEHKADQLFIFLCLPGVSISGSCITCSSPVEYSIHNTELEWGSHSVILSWKPFTLLRVSWLFVTHYLHALIQKELLTASNSAFKAQDNQQAMPENTQAVKERAQCVSGIKRQRRSHSKTRSQGMPPEGRGKEIYKLQ